MCVSDAYKEVAASNSWREVRKVQEDHWLFSLLSRLLRQDAVLTFKSVDAYEVLSHDEMKATEQFFSEVPFHTLHKVVPDFADSVDET